MGESCDLHIAVNLRNSFDGCLHQLAYGLGFWVVRIALPPFRKGEKGDFAGREVQEAGGNEW